MNVSKILDASEMSTKRLVTDFVVWVKLKAEKLSANPEAKIFARSGTQLSKKFYDELYPLALFVEHEFKSQPDAVITPNLGNDNFDAIVSFRDGADPLFIEITRAKDGYDESLREEVLTREGSVCLTGPILRVSGRRGEPNRTIEVQDEAISHEILLHKHLSLVEDRLRDKANRIYGKQHLLLLVVDDYLPFHEDSDQYALHLLIKRLLLSSELDFIRLVVLGISGKVILSYRLPKYTQNEASL